MSRNFHDAVAGNAHPDGKPFTYCRICSYAVVELAGRIWHLRVKAATPARPTKVAVAKPMHYCTVVVGTIQCVECGKVGGKVSE